MNADLWGEYERMIKRKLFSRLLGILVGISVAFVSYSYAVNKLLNYDESAFYNRLDLYNIVLLTDEFEKYEYLTRTDNTLTFLPFLFLFIGTFLVSSSFMTKQKSYHTFILPRVGNRRGATVHIKGQTTDRSTIYVVSFFITLYALSLFALPGDFSEALPMKEMKLVFLLILHAVLKIMLLQMLSSVAFLLYRIKNVSISFVGSTFMIVALFIADIQWKGGNILLFSFGNLFIESIIIVSITYVLIHLCNTSKLKIDYLE